MSEDWYGRIPRESKKCKLKNLGNFQSGVDLTSFDIEAEGAYPVYGGNGLRGYYDKYLYDGDYLIVGRQGALCGNVHHVTGKFWPTEHAVTVTPHDDIDINWLYYMLITMNLGQYSRAAAQPGISVDYIKNINTYFPDIDDQKSIASQLDAQCAKIDACLAAITRETALLQEYRTRLIADVVTGKIKTTENTETAQAPTTEIKQEKI
jgi:type I restriction enzyme S subunit